ncbi:MAG: hypothetical protein KC445_07060 [Anaerolineales bacterium]|nr:hypothetical protein [Anaerolineales bacterium]
MNKSSKSPMIKYAFVIFGILIGSINAVLTAVFSFTYLPAAFGNPNGLLAPYLAAFYGLLIMDVAYLAWFYVYLRLAESKEQRGLSLFMAIASLAASIMATITQLATNSFGLVDLTAYSETVGLIAMGVMIAVTALHIICFASYTLTDPTESVKTKMTNAKADMLQDALAAAESRVKDDKSVLVDLIAADMRRDILHQLGFTPDYSRISEGKAVSQEPVQASKPKGFFVQIEDMNEDSGWYTVNERPFPTLDLANEEIDKHPRSRRRIIDENGVAVLRSREAKPDRFRSYSPTAKRGLARQRHQQELSASDEQLANEQINGATAD